jgi:Epoxide hydrolase N terminus
MPAAGGAIMSKMPTTRRTLNAMLLAAASAPLLSQCQLYAQAAGSAPQSFRVDIPQAKIDRILTRVREAEWPDRLDAPDLRYGVSWDYMKALATYWIEQYDWRKAEANLNRHPQFLTRIGDYDIHFYHVKGHGPKPLPLILTHGWPGSTFEFLEAIGPLSDPARGRPTTPSMWLFHRCPASAFLRSRSESRSAERRSPRFGISS